MENKSALRHPDLLVGVGTRDDAGVYRLDGETALVQSVDFFTPVVDEAFDWGRIAAANALSDIYAMGGVPLTALSIVGWPRDRLPFDLLGEVLQGSADVLEEARCTLVGGHSVDDPEPKVGLAVTGTVHPDRIVTNQGARPGDVLVLTKPLGTGVISTGIKQGVASPEWRDAAVASMAALNEGAARAMLAVGAGAATDVTGFGLFGHLAEMLSGGLGAEVDYEAVPMLPGARDLAAAGVVPGGTRRNLAALAGRADFAAVDEVARLLLADAQTSGGLLIAVGPERADDLIAALAGTAAAAARIGQITADQAGTIRAL